MIGFQANRTSEIELALFALQWASQILAGNNPKKHRGFGLHKRANKHLGFVYYVRYWHNGKRLPSKWCTHTNILSEAEKFAALNRERIVSSYLRSHSDDAYKLLADYFSKESAYWKLESKRNGEISESRRRLLELTITQKFIPFLKEQNIADFSAVEVKTLYDFQDWLLLKGLKPQTVNSCLVPVGKVFAYLTRKGVLSKNPYKELEPVPVRPSDRSTHGIFDLDRLKGVFSKPWENERSRLLCMLIYTTDMRNSEILRLRKADIEQIDGCRFIRLRQSKSVNGIRMVPLHNHVYHALVSFAASIPDDARVFAKKHRQFSLASGALASHLGTSEQELKKENISFYSGRSFWKTLMSANGLGEGIEEVFMGHRVSSDVAKLYNHRDKHGKERIAAKAREVFAILDKCVFL